MTAYMDHKNLANEVIDDARAREITDGVHRVLDRIAAAEEQAGREAGSVRLLAATKTRDIGEIMVAIDAGVRMIGENRPQEVTAKAKGLARRCAERGFSLGVAGVAPDAAAENSASRRALSTRLLRMRSRRTAVQRPAAIFSPARLMTASISLCGPKPMTCLWMSQKGRAQGARRRASG